MMIHKRLCLAAVFLAIIVLLAWGQNANADVPWADAVNRLTRYEAAHVVGHIVIFCCVALLLTSRDRRRPVLVWSAVLIGGVSIEVAQALASNFPLSLHLLKGSVFDLAVDVLGAGIGLLMRR